MRHYLFAALAFALWLASGAPTAAQGCGQTNPNCIVPTRPLGDNGSAAASTAFIFQAINPIKDISEIVGSGAAKWNPLFFGNAGTGIVHRLNRIFCGEATASSSDVGPVTTKDWLETLIANTTGVAEFVCVDTTGQLGVVGASRSSDFRTVFGSATGGAQGVTGIGYNNDTTGAPVGLGLYGVGIRASGVSGTTLATQLDISNGGTVVDVTPFGGVVGGSTFGNLMTAGAIGSLATANPSAAWAVGAGATAKFRKGGVFFNGALDTSIGDSGGGIALELYDLQELRWLNSSNVLIGSIYGSSSLNGININGANIEFGSSASWSANGSVNTSVTGVGPAGASTTVVKWFTIVDNTGAKRFIPAF